MPIWFNFTCKTNHGSYYKSCTSIIKPNHTFNDLLKIEDLLAKIGPNEEYVFYLKDKYFTSLDFNKKFSTLVEMKDNQTIPFYVTSATKALKLSELKDSSKKQSKELIIKMDQLTLNADDFEFFPRQFSKYKKLGIDLSSLSNGATLNESSARLLTKTLSMKPNLPISIYYQNQYEESLNALYEAEILLLRHLETIADLNILPSELKIIICSYVYVWNLQHPFALFTENSPLHGTYYTDIGLSGDLGEDLFDNNPMANFIARSMNELKSIGSMIDEIHFAPLSDKKKPAHIKATVHTDKLNLFLTQAHDVFAKQPIYQEKIFAIETKEEKPKQVQEKAISRSIVKAKSAKHYAVAALSYFGITSHKRKLELQQQDELVQKKQPVTQVSLTLHGIYRPHVEAFARSVSLLKKGVGFY
jgi:hypothetical protein